MNRMVGDVMATPVVTVAPSASFKRTVQVLQEHQISAVPVLDPEGRLLGMVSETDLALKRSTRRTSRRPGAPGNPARPAGQGPRDHGRRLHVQGGGHGDAGSVAAGGRPAAAPARVRHLPVVDHHGRVVGMITRRDLLGVFLVADWGLAGEVNAKVLHTTFNVPADAVRVEVREGGAAVGAGAVAQHRGRDRRAGAGGGRRGRGGRPPHLGPQRHRRPRGNTAVRAMLTNEVADLERRPASMARMILDRVAATPDREAFRYPDGDRWASLDWRRVGDRVRAIAAGLLALGVGPEDRVAIAASTRLEWVLADFGILCAGAATTTIYPSTPDTDVAYILRDSGARVVFAEDDEQLAKLRAHRAELPRLLKVVRFDGAGGDDWAMGLAELERVGRERLLGQPAAVDDAVAAIGPERLATLMYTSGTTGRPKGSGWSMTTGPTKARPSRRWSCCGPTTSSTCGCRCRTPSARCCCRPSSRSGSPRPSTGASQSWLTTWQ